MQNHRNTLLPICKYCHQNFFTYNKRRIFCSQDCYHAHRSSMLVQRFWSHVEKTDTCWLWHGYRMKNGYGQVGINSTTVMYAHRFSWEQHYGPIPEGLIICHTCDNPPCVNPDHLFLGEHQDNMNDKVAKGRHPRGEKSYKAHLTDEQVMTIRRLYATGNFTQEQLAPMFGVHRVTISKIILGIRWKHLL